MRFDVLADIHANLEAFQAREKSGTQDWAEGRTVRVRSDYFLKSQRSSVSSRLISKQVTIGKWTLKLPRV